MAYKNPSNAIPSQPAHDYERQFDFTGFATGFPNQPLPGAAVDDELNHVERALDETQDRLDLIQRADGALKNESVHSEALAPAVYTVLAAGAEATAEQWVITYAAQYMAPLRDETLGYRNDALGYRNDALTYRDDALGYSNDAFAHRTDANASRLASESARDLALSYRDTALSHRNDAGVFRDEAVASAAEAQNTVTVFNSGYLGFTEANGYDFGSVTTLVTYFDRDFGGLV